MIDKSLYDKENISRNMLFPREKLGSVPECNTMGEHKRLDKVTKRKLESMEMELNMDGGEKRVAVIDPLQALNARSRIARKLLVSPLQIITSKKRSLSSLDTNGNDIKKKKIQSYNNRVIEFNDDLRLEMFTGKMKTAVTRAVIEREFDAFVKTVNQVQGVDESKVFDSCPEVVSKIKKFLQTYTMVDRYLLCKHLQVHGNTFNAFLHGQNQTRCDNVTYKNAYVFFEKLRVHFGESKSAARRFNEANHPNGFSLRKPIKKRGGFALGAANHNHDFC